MTHLDLSIGILTWKAWQTLAHSLESWRQAGLFALARENLLFAQEASEQDAALAREYQLELIPSATNLSMGPAFAALAHRARGRYLLLLENDWWIQPDVCERVEQELRQALFMLISRRADVVRLRRRDQPGEPLYSRQYAGNELAGAFHLLDSVHWRAHPDLDFPGKIRRDPDTGFYLASSLHANFTNNPCIWSTRYYREKITPFAQVGQDLEITLSDWWEVQPVTVAQGEGLFTHWRLDR